MQQSNVVTRVEELFYEGMAVLFWGAVMLIFYGLIWWYAAFFFYAEKYGEKAAIEMMYKVFLVPDHQREHTIFKVIGHNYDAPVINDR